MARKFSDELNADIRRTMRSAIQKVRRAEKRGEKGLPTLPTVREFKAMYATEEDAKRNLRQYRAMLNNKEALQRYRTKEGTITNWEFGFIVQNLQETKRKVERELMKEQARVKDYPDHLYAIKSNVLRLEAERDYLNRDLDQLTARELKTVSATIQRVQRSDLRTIAGRKHFMKMLDTILTAQTFSSKQRQNIYQKINNLTNEEFAELYKNNDMVRTIMERYVPEDEGKINIYEEVTQDVENEELAKQFSNNLDEAISNAKESVKQINKLVEAGTGKVYTKEEYMKYLKSGKWIGK